MKLWIIWNLFRLLRVVGGGSLGFQNSREVLSFRWLNADTYLWKLFPQIEENQAAILLRQARTVYCMYGHFFIACGSPAQLAREGPVANAWPPLGLRARKTRKIFEIWNARNTPMTSRQLSDVRSSQLISGTSMARLSTIVVLVLMAIKQNKIKYIRI
jgi:hypothetical protein